MPPRPRRRAAAALPATPVVPAHAADAAMPPLPPTPAGAAGAAPPRAAGRPAAAAAASSAGRAGATSRARATGRPTGRRRPVAPVPVVPPPPPMPPVPPPPEQSDEASPLTSATGSAGVAAPGSTDGRRSAVVFAATPDVAVEPTGVDVDRAADVLGDVDAQLQRGRGRPVPRRARTADLGARPCTTTTRTLSIGVTSVVRLTSTSERPFSVQLTPEASTPTATKAKAAKRVMGSHVRAGWA